MGRLFAVLGGLFGVLLVPLSLVAPTAWLVLPGHLALTVLATVAALHAGWIGRAERARLWGLGYLVATIAMVAALQLGREVSGGVWWVFPWFAAVLWGWIPPVVAGLSGWVGDAVRDARSRRAVRRRHRRAASAG